MQSEASPGTSSGGNHGKAMSSDVFFFTVVLAKMPVKVECIGDGRIIESRPLRYRLDTRDNPQQPQEERTMKT